MKKEGQRSHKANTHTHTHTKRGKNDCWLVGNYDERATRALCVCVPLSFCPKKSCVGLCCVVVVVLLLLLSLVLSMMLLCAVKNVHIVGDLLFLHRRNLPKMWSRMTEPINTSDTTNTAMGPTLRPALSSLKKLRPIMPPPLPIVALLDAPERGRLCAPALVVLGRATTP